MTDNSVAIQNPNVRVNNNNLFKTRGNLCLHLLHSLVSHTICSTVVHGYKFDSCIKCNSNVSGER